MSEVGTLVLTIEKVPDTETIIIALYLRQRRGGHTTTKSSSVTLYIVTGN
jgi:hypothetical protein